MNERKYEAENEFNQKELSRFGKTIPIKPLSLFLSAHVEWRVIASSAKQIV